MGDELVSIFRLFRLAGGGGGGVSEYLKTVLVCVRLWGGGGCEYLTVCLGFYRLFFWRGSE